MTHKYKKPFKIRKRKTDFGNSLKAEMIAHYIEFKLRSWLMNPDYKITKETPNYFTNKKERDIIKQNIKNIIDK